MKLTKYFLLIVTSLLVLTSCLKDDTEIVHHYYTAEGHEMMSKYLNIPASPLEYQFTFPKHYNGATTIFEDDLATLGRVLFYDKNLSEDNTISCASCHSQASAFADNVDFSEGVRGRRTSRNSLALGSVFSFDEYYGSVSFGRIPFFWDNRASSVQEQSKQTFGNKNEMDMNMDQVIERVESLEYYDPLFKASFDGSTRVSEDRILDAIGEFVNSIGSFSSKYDKAMDKYINTYGSFNNPETNYLNGLSQSENRGKTLYIESCGGCHGNTNGFPGQVSANNGLDANYLDKGENGQSKFKVPTLRNITLTAPYMHDGRFDTLGEVIDHYSTNIVNHPKLDARLKVGSTAKKFNFTAEQKQDLLNFMDTFVDEEFLEDERYSDPFIR